MTDFEEILPIWKDLVRLATMSPDVPNYVSLLNVPIVDKDALRLRYVRQEEGYYLLSNSHWYCLADLKRGESDRGRS